MPQGPIPVSQVPRIGGNSTKLFIQNAPVLVKAAAGVIATVVVLAAGSATGTINDCTATAAAVTANEVAVIPQTVGPIVLNFPCTTGICVSPGTGQQVSVSYD